MSEELTTSEITICGLCLTQLLTYSNLLQSFMSISYFGKSSENTLGLFGFMREKSSFPGAGMSVRSRLVLGFEWRGGWGSGYRGLYRVVHWRGQTGRGCILSLLTTVKSITRTQVKGHHRNVDSWRAGKHFTMIAKIWMSRYRSVV